MFQQNIFKKNKNIITSDEYQSIRLSQNYYAKSPANVAVISPQEDFVNRIMFPEIEKADSSYFIYDIDGEIFEKIGPALAMAGYEVAIIAPNTNNLASSEFCVSYNPLRLCQCDQDINKLSQSIIQGASNRKSGSAFWGYSEQELLSLVIKSLKNVPNCTMEDLNQKLSYLMEHSEDSNFYFGNNKKFATDFSPAMRIMMCKVLLQKIAPFLDFISSEDSLSLSLLPKRTAIFAIATQDDDKNIVLSTLCDQFLNLYSKIPSNSDFAKVFLPNHFISFKSITAKNFNYSNISIITGDTSFSHFVDFELIQSLKNAVFFFKNNEKEQQSFCDFTNSVFKEQISMKDMSAMSYGNVMITANDGNLIDRMAGYDY